MKNNKDRRRKTANPKKGRKYRKPSLTKHGALNADVAAFSMLY